MLHLAHFVLIYKITYPSIYLNTFILVYVGVNFVLTSYSIAQVKSMNEFSRTKQFDAAVKSMKTGVAREFKFHANFDAASCAQAEEGAIGSSVVVLVCYFHERLCFVINRCALVLVGFRWVLIQTPVRYVNLATVFTFESITYTILIYTDVSQAPAQQQQPVHHPAVQAIVEMFLVIGASQQPSHRLCWNPHDPRTLIHDRIRRFQFQQCTSEHSKANLIHQLQRWAQLSTATTTMESFGATS